MSGRAARAWVFGASLLSTVAAASPWPAGQSASPACARLGLAEIKDALGSGFITPQVLVADFERCGVAFVLGAQDEAALSRLGANEVLLSRLRPPARPQMGATWRSLTDRRELAWVAPGTFTMGSPSDEPGRHANEEAGDVRIEAGFWLDVAEVTNDAYQRFVRAQPEWGKGRLPQSPTYLEDWVGDSYPPNAGSLPVTFVTWAAAQAYARWAGKRLPTEAEWEYAARAGTSGPYWWGGTVFQANRANDGEGTWPVGRDLARNGWGFFDMLGNVWEWTASAARAYPYQARDGREDAPGTDPRIVRGGSFGSHLDFLRVAKRHQLRPDAATYNVGFRCAMSPPAGVPPAR